MNTWYRLDAETRAAVADLEVDATTRYRLTRTYGDLDATEREQLRSLIDGDGDVASNAADLDPSGVRAALDYACNSPCSIQLDFTSPMWRVSDDVRDSLRGRLDADQYARLVDSEVGSDALRTADDLDSITAIRNVDGDLVVRGQKAGIDVKVTRPADEPGFYTRNSDDSIAEIRGRNPQQIGVDPIEADIAPKLIDQREGWEVVYGKQKGGTEQGIDVIAKDPNGDYVVTEVKFTTKSEAIDRDRVSASSRTAADGTEVDQMENGWIETSFDEDIGRGDMDISDEYDRLQQAIEFENYRKEAFIVQDSAVGETIDGDLANLGIDDTTIVRTSGATQ